MPIKKIKEKFVKLFVKNAKINDIEIQEENVTLECEMIPETVISKIDTSDLDWNKRLRHKRRGRRAIRELNKVNKNV